jgi:hypothetical protein
LLFFYRSTITTLITWERNILAQIMAENMVGNDCLGSETRSEEKLGRNQTDSTGDADNQVTVPPIATSGDLEKSSAQESPNDATPPATIKPPMFEVPDGGLAAWLQVAGGFSLLFNTWYIVSRSSTCVAEPS